MSRARSRARKRAFEALNWADKRHIVNMAENTATRQQSTPQAKPQWVLNVESSGYQSIGGDRRSSRATGLTRAQREANRAVRSKRPKTENVHTVKVRQVRTDGRDALMSGTDHTRGQTFDVPRAYGRPKLLKLPLGTVVRASRRPEYRKPKTTPSPYTR